MFRNLYLLFEKNILIQWIVEIIDNEVGFSDQIVAEGSHDAIVCRVPMLL